MDNRKGMGFKKAFGRSLSILGMLLAAPAILAGIPGALLVFLGEAFEEGSCNDRIRKGIEEEHAGRQGSRK